MGSIPVEGTIFLPLAKNMKPSGFASCRDSGASCTVGAFHTLRGVLHSPPDDEALLCNMKQLRYEALALLA